MATREQIAGAALDAARELLKGGGQIRATARYPEIDAFIVKHHGSPRALTPQEVQVMAQEGEAQLRVIRRNWPVRTGTSRAGWRFRVTPQPGRVALVIENPVYYSAWVTKKGQVPVRLGGRPWFMVLLPEVAKANKARLLRRVKEQILKTEAEIALSQQALGIARQQVGQALNLTGSEGIIRSSMPKTLKQIERALRRATP